MNHFQNWIISWADLLDGIVGIVTFGYIIPGFAFNVVCYFMRQNVKKFIKENIK